MLKPISEVRNVVLTRITAKKWPDAQTRMLPNCYLVQLIFKRYYALNCDLCHTFAKRYFAALYFGSKMAQIKK